MDTNQTNNTTNPMIIWITNNGKLTFDSDSCVDCGYCTDLCPSEAIENTQNGTRVDPSKCSKCLECLDFCDLEAFQFNATYNFKSVRSIF